MLEPAQRLTGVPDMTTERRGDAADVLFQQVAQAAGQLRSSYDCLCSEEAGVIKMRSPEVGAETLEHPAGGDAAKVRHPDVSHRTTDRVCHRRADYPRTTSLRSPEASVTRFSSLARRRVSYHK